MANRATIDSAPRVMAPRSDIEIIAQEVSTLGAKVAAMEERLREIDKVIARLEGAALTTAQALKEVSHHWDAVYEAMRRAAEPDLGQLRGDWDRPRPRKPKTPFPLRSQLAAVAMVETCRGAFAASAHE